MREIGPLAVVAAMPHGGGISTASLPTQVARIEVSGRQPIWTLIPFDIAALSWGPPFSRRVPRNPIFGCRISRSPWDDRGSVQSTPAVFQADTHLFADTGHIDGHSGPRNIVAEDAGGRVVFIELLEAKPIPPGRW